jgi:hypothetical protein
MAFGRLPKCRRDSIVSWKGGNRWAVAIQAGDLEEAPKPIFNTFSGLERYKGRRPAVEVGRQSYRRDKNDNDK